MVNIEQYAEFMYELLNAQLGINQHKIDQIWHKNKRSCPEKYPIGPYTPATQTQYKSIPDLVVQSKNWRRIEV